MSPSVLALLALLPLGLPVLAQTSLADFQQNILAGLQAQGLTQSTAVLASVASNETALALLKNVYATSNETAWTFYSPTNEGEHPFSIIPSPVTIMSAKLTSA